MSLTIGLKNDVYRKAGFSAIHELKWSALSAIVSTGPICKKYVVKQFVPIVLIIHQLLELGLWSLIKALIEALGLRMICTGNLILKACEFLKLIYQLIAKLSALVKTIFKGQLWRCIFLWRNSATYFASFIGIGAASPHFEK